MSKGKFIAQSCADCAWKNNCNVRRDNDAAGGCTMFVKKVAARENMLTKIAHEPKMSQKKRKITSELTKRDMVQIRFALEHLHDTDLSEYGDKNVADLENVMRKLGLQFVSQL